MDPVITMIGYALIVAGSSFVYIAAKAFQQLNVVHNNKKMVPIMTAIMAVCEVVVIGNIAIQTTNGSVAGISVTIVAMTIGSSLGALSSMWLHRKMRERAA